VTALFHGYWYRVAYVGCPVCMLGVLVHMLGVLVHMLGVLVRMLGVLVCFIVLKTFLFNSTFNADID